MNTMTRPYVERSAHYLNQASHELEQGDTLQASHKGWGAAAQIVKAVAQERGWEHVHHAQIIAAVRRVVAETGDNDVLIAFQMARGLHENFYEGELEADNVDVSLRHVASLVEKLRALIDD